MSTIHPTYTIHPSTVMGKSSIFLDSESLPILARIAGSIRVPHGEEAAADSMRGMPTI